MSKEHVYEHFLNRFLRLYGDPKTDEVAGFLEEYATALAGVPVVALQKAADFLIRTHKFKSWPTVAECREAVDDATPRQAFASPNFGAKVEPATPEARARVRALAEEFKRNIRRVPVVGISKRAALTEQGVSVKSEDERRAEFAAFVRDGEARMYQRDSGAIREQMVALAEKTMGRAR